MTKHGKFIVHDGNLLYQEICADESVSKTEKVANFVPVVEAWKQYRNEEGIVENEYTLAVESHGGAIFTLKSEDHTRSKLERIFGGIYLIEKIEMFKRYLAILYDEYAKSGKVERYFSYTGMTVIDGMRVFLANGYSITAEGLTDAVTVETSQEMQAYRFIKADIPLEDAASIVLYDLQKVVPERVVMPILSYIMLTPIMEILRACGKEPNYILAVIGKTGTGKTSLIKAMMALQGDFRGSAPASYEGTPNSLLSKLTHLNDLVLILDDRRPSTGKTDRERYEQIERVLSSAIGDRAVRSRANTDGSLQAEKPSKALVLTTGETLHENMAESTVARYVDVFLKDTDMDWDQLGELQQSGAKLNVFMQEYIAWVIRNYDDIQVGMENLFNQCKEKLSLSGHKRIAYNYASLLVSYTLLMHFCRDNSLLTAEESKAREENAARLFQESAETQKGTVESANPVDQFVEAVKTLEQQAKIYFQSLSMRHSQDDHPYPTTYGSTMIGYKDEKYYWFLPGAIMAEIGKMYHAQGKEFPFDEKSLFRMMRDQQKLKVDGRNLTSKKTVDGRATRMYAVPIRVIEGGDDNGFDQQD